VNELCADFGIEYPIFAFSHCRDVVAAVSRAGGMGVLGIVAFSPEQIDIELDWLDQHSGGRPYGVDVVVPVSTVDRDKQLAGSASRPRELRAMIPPSHWDYAESLMAEHGVPTLTAQERDERYGDGDATTGGFTASGGRDQIAAVLARRPPFLVSALGPPPIEVVEQVHAYGGKVGTLVGKPHQAVRGAQAGVDVIICQSYEAAAHTGEIGSMVLTPDVVDAVGDVPVLAAGGIGSGRQMAAAMCLGAQGVWTGSIWLTTQESETEPALVDRMLAMSATDTVRSRAQTGKPNRQMRTAWTEAWDAPEGPGALSTPLQYILYREYTDRAKRAGARELVGGPVGQVVGRMNKVRSVADVMQEMVEEYIATVERMAAVLG